MPPKKKATAQKSAKTEKKEKEKIIQDKTFGLKNKNKSKKVQQYCQSVQNRVQNQTKRDIIEAQRKKDEKALAEQQKRELEILTRPAITQPKVPPGVDPKTVLCEFFRQGCCTKGSNCKFSHDLEIAIKIAQQQSQKPEEEVDKNDVFASQEKLNRSVTAKFEERNKNAKTKQVCKYFLEALDTRKFGSNWECPSGLKCPYVHSIPKGWVVKRKDEPKEEEEEEEVPVEEIIDEERQELAMNSTNPKLLTLEVFQEWLKDFEKKEAERIEKEKANTIAETKANPSHKVMLSGKQLLIMKPSIAVDDADAMDENEVERQTEEEFDQLQAIQLQRALNKDSAGLVDQKYLVNYDDVANELKNAENENNEECEKETEIEKETAVEKEIEEEKENDEECEKETEIEKETIVEKETEV